MIEWEILRSKLQDIKKSKVSEISSEEEVSEAEDYIASIVSEIFPDEGEYLITEEVLNMDKYSQTTIVI